MTTDLGGAATLLRTAQAVDVRISTSALDHYAAYTVWWVVFNRPAARVGGCGSTIGLPWRVAQKIGSVDGACDVNVCAEQQAVGFNAVR